MLSEGEMDFPQLRECINLCQLLQSSDKQIRKQAIINFKNVIKCETRLSTEEYHEIFRTCHMHFLNALRDSSEPVREHAINLMNTLILETLPSNDYYLSYICPILVERIGSVEIVEESEELRLKLIIFMYNVLDSYNEHQLQPFVNDFITILQQTVQDRYSVIKETSCKCIIHFAHCLPKCFHMEATQLVNPVLSSFGHQRYKVRVEAIKCIGEIVKYTDYNALVMSVGPMAQRLFDSMPIVRQTVIQVAAKWMLEYRDRYSFFHKLLPLVLTGLNDEIDETRLLAENLWQQVGMQYEKENEKDLKDQMDYLNQPPKYYPPSVTRPNLGCRVLVQRNLGKLAHAIGNELRSWQRDVRIRCGQLLKALALHAEDGITQHLPILLQGMFNAIRDGNRKHLHMLVVEAVKIMAVFVPVDNWMKLVIPTIEGGHFGHLAILAAFVQGAPKECIASALLQITEVIASPEVAYNQNLTQQIELINCIHAIESQYTPNLPIDIGQRLFNTIVIVISIRHESPEAMNAKLLDDLQCTLRFRNKQHLWHRFTRPLLVEISTDPLSWGEKSIDRRIFNTILLQSGSAFGECLDLIGNVLIDALHQTVPPEARWKTFLALSSALDHKRVTLKNAKNLEQFLFLLITKIFVPNLIWRPGRTAEKMRQLAANCLVNTLAPCELELFDSKESLRGMVNEVTELLISLSEDSLEQSRQLALESMLLLKVRMVKNEIWHVTDLIKIYPEFLKRLDDPADTVRVYAIKTLKHILQDTPKDFLEPTFRGHHELLIDTLITHFDDDENDFRSLVHEVINIMAEINAFMLKEKIERHKPIVSNQSGCDEILMYLDSLHIN